MSGYVRSIMNKGEKQMALDTLVKALNKKFGAGTIGTPKDLGREHIERLSTGIFSLDIATGGGWPKGRIVELIGELSAGKTYVANRAIVECQKEGKAVVYVDAENCFDKDWAEKIGVNIDDLLIAQPSTGEQTLDIVDAVVRDNQAGLVVVDSVGAIGATVELDDSMEKQQMGVNARMMNKAIRKIHSALNVCGEEGEPNQTLIMFINQIRLKIGVMFGSPETTPGGKGLGFAASVRVKVRKLGFVDAKLKEKKQHVGQYDAFTIIKNKTFPPYKEGNFQFMFRDVPDGSLKAGQEVHPYDVILAGIQTEFFERAGSTYKYNGKSYRGENHLVDSFASDPKGLEQLEHEIKEYALKVRD